MANQEQLSVLKQGVPVWNQWKKEHADVKVDLIEANFSGADLCEVNFSNADLIKADLSRSDLSSANLHRANLNGADLSGANLRSAKLNRADLIKANLTETDLIESDFSEARIGLTIFGNADLSLVKGLETVRNIGPSTIGIDTIIQSQGKISEIFLRNAGIPASIIEAIPSLIGSLRPIEYYTCFISYSSKDEDFARRIYADLRSNNVRCWYAPEDLKIGDKIRPRIDESIRLYDKLLVVLSQSSVTSQWVEHEVETAMGKELEGVSNVLFPVRLDDAILESKAGWASHIRLTRHIGDFTLWKHHDEYQKSFQRLLRDLQAKDKSNDE